jgi:WhiB family transcriptional regulator, redox-sensing transcriptional regulator
MWSSAQAVRQATPDADEAWESRAQCRGGDGEIFFTPGAAQEFRAKAVCRSCPVRWECLAYALKNRVEHGVWGGLTDRERRRVLNRAHPLSWDPETAARAVS